MVTETPPTTAVLAGRYQLADLLGRGGMSEVYRGEDQLLHRPVAVKLLRNSSDGLDASADEVHLLARFQHPHLVRLLDAGVDDGTRYVVMELVDGQTLTRAIDGMPMEPQRVAVLGRQVAEALAYVQAAGVVHRDVKPGNVLLDGEGKAKLTDFGIARLIDATRATPTGFAVGTAAYLAPEQVTGGHVGPAADVYALGLLLLECLKGQIEYPGSAVEAAVARLHRAPAVPTDLGREWQSLLGEVTATDPQNRPSAASVARRLRTLSTASAHRSAPVAVPAARVVSRSGRGRRIGRRAALIGATTAVLIVGTGVGLAEISPFADRPGSGAGPHIGHKSPATESVVVPGANAPTAGPTPTAGAGAAAEGLTASGGAAPGAKSGGNTAASSNSGSGTTSRSGATSGSSSAANSDAGTGSRSSGASSTAGRGGSSSAGRTGGSTGSRTTSRTSRTSRTGGSASPPAPSTSSSYGPSYYGGGSSGSGSGSSSSGHGGSDDSSRSGSGSGSDG